MKLYLTYINTRYVIENSFPPNKIYRPPLLIAIPDNKVHGENMVLSPDDSRFKDFSKAFIQQCTDINHTNQWLMWKQTNISWWVHVWRPLLRPYGRYHKCHQRMLGSTGRIKVSRYASNNNNKKINAIEGNKCGETEQVIIKQRKKTHEPCYRGCFYEWLSMWEANG